MGLWVRTELLSVICGLASVVIWKETDRIRAGHKFSGEPTDSLCPSPSSCEPPAHSLAPHHMSVPRHQSCCVSMLPLMLSEQLDLPGPQHTPPLEIQASGQPRAGAGGGGERDESRQQQGPSDLFWGLSAASAGQARTPSTPTPYATLPLGPTSQPGPDWGVGWCIGCRG